MKCTATCSVNATRRDIAMIALIVTLAVSTGCDRNVATAKPVPAPAQPEVVTVLVKAGDAQRELRLPARAMAGEYARISARATGFVESRKAELGDRVEAGQVLAVIAAPEIDQDVRAAEAALGQARADAELARLNFERAKSLIGSGAISKEMYSDREAAEAVAGAARAVAVARLASARERQGFTSVRAPFAGVIVARNVERGDRVVADQTAATSLFDIAALDPLRILVDVPQRAALDVRAGLDAEVSFIELPGESLSATVVRSAQSISEAAGGMRVELSLPNPGERIPAGMIGEVRLQLATRGQTVRVPISAVVQGADGVKVATVGEDSTLAYRAVTVGRNLGSEIEIVKGLSAGERIVASPNALLVDGTRVTAKPAAAP